MSLVKKAALVVVTLSLASAAALAESHYTATMAQPLTEKVQFVVEGNMFRCERATCTLVSTPTNALSVYTCRALRRKVGPLTAYGPFDAAQLAKCNASN